MARAGEVAADGRDYAHTACDSAHTTKIPRNIIVHPWKKKYDFGDGLIFVVGAKGLVFRCLFNGAEETEVKKVRFWLFSSHFCEVCDNQAR